MFADSIAVLNRIIKQVQGKEIKVMNPVNKQLQDENEKLIKKLADRQWLWWYFIGSVLVFVFLVFRFVKVKF